MPDYKSMYYKLFGKTSSAIEVLEATLLELKIAQRETEEMYIAGKKTTREAKPKKTRAAL